MQISGYCNQRHTCTKKFLTGDENDLKELQNFVPETTYAFLISPQGTALKKQLSAQRGGIL